MPIQLFSFSSMLLSLVNVEISRTTLFLVAELVLFFLLLEALVKHDIAFVLLTELNHGTSLGMCSSGSVNCGY